LAGSGSIIEKMEFNTLRKAA